MSGVLIIAHRHSRGAVAIMALVFSVMGILLMTACLEFGFLLSKKRQSDQAADAMATAWGLHVRDASSDLWFAPNFSAQAVKQASMTSADAIASTTYQTAQIDAGAWTRPGIQYADAWLPLFVTIQGTYPVHDSTRIGSLMQGGGILGLGAQLPTIQSFSKVRVSQVQLGRFVMQPERVILLLDFSKTMLLNYAPKGISTGTPAYTILQQSASTIIDRYGSLINLGVRCFSDGVTPDIFRNPLDQNSMTQTSSANQQSYIQNRVQSIVPMGDGTDLQKAVQDATDSLRAAGASTAGSPYSSGARIILITDGEPDKQGGTSAGSSGNRDEQIAAFRQKVLQTMDAAWNSNSVAPGGVTSDVIMIQRQGESGEKINGISTEDFLSSLAGTRTSHDGQMFSRRRWRSKSH